MMKKGLILTTVFLMVFALAGMATAGPSTLKAAYVTDNRVDLTWTAQPTETYKVWKSTDGTSWTSIFTTNQGAADYSVTSGITPYVNYYFAVTVSNVTYYPGGSTESNATNEVSAFPPNQYAHGYYSANTALCKNCHNTHTSTGPKLLSFATVNDTCMSCHDGTGSKYDVITGQVSTNDNGTETIAAPAGPFGGMAFGKTALDNEPESIHTLGSVINTAPGGNTNGSGKWGENLGCGSCHDAHGSTNYRMLKMALPYMEEGQTKIDVKAYAVTDIANDKEDVNYISGMNDFCMGCHPAYNAPKGSGTTKYSVEINGTVSGEAYRHSVGDGVYPAMYSRGGVPNPLTTSLPLEGTDPDKNKNKVICLTCHTAHGSNQPSVFTESVITDGETSVTNFLLRMENMGVCQDCHKL